MQSGLYIALAGQRTLQSQLEVIANNVANSTTPGFKAEGVSFKSLLSDAENDLLSFPAAGKNYSDFRSGALQPTGSDFDMALNGDGWFGIETPAGIAYTRDGRMTATAEGELISSAGFPILDASGAPVVINPGGGPIRIYPDGRVEQDGALRGNIGVFSVPEESLTSRFENSAFYSTAEAETIVPGAGTRIAQGFVEASNVDPVMETARLMQVMQMFQSISSALSDTEGAMSRSVRDMNVV